MITEGAKTMSESSTNNKPAMSPRSNPLSDQALDQIRDSLRGLNYGVVSIIVQDGVVVQIERTEKRRLRKSEPRGDS